MKRFIRSFNAKTLSLILSIAALATAITTSFSVHILPESIGLPVFFLQIAVIIIGGMLGIIFGILSQPKRTLGGLLGIGIGIVALITFFVIVMF